MSADDLHDMMRDAKAHGSALLYTPGTCHGFELVPMPRDGEGVTTYGEETNDEYV